MESAIPVPKKRRRRWLQWGRLRQFPKWLYSVEWPVKRVDLTFVTRDEKREIVSRLIAYLMYPSPSPRKQGGRSSRRQDRKSPTPKSKATKLMRDQRKTDESLKASFAHSYAAQLRRLERSAGHLTIGGHNKYEQLVEEFRRLEGFSRLLGTAGIHLSQLTINKHEWSQLVAAFHVFDLLHRMLLAADADVRAVLSETTALHIVLLRQTVLGLRLNHPALSETCRRYRSVAHILVGLFSAWRGRRSPDVWALECSNLAPGVEGLKDLLSPTVPAAIALGREAELAFRSSRIARKGEPTISEEYQVRLPESLKVPRSKQTFSALQSDELQLLLALKGLRDARRRRAKPPEWFIAIPIQSLTSASSDRAARELIKCAREIGVRL